MSWERTVEKFHWLSEAFADADLRGRIVDAVENLDGRPLLEFMVRLAKVRPAATYPTSHPGIQ
jgi:2-methylcitrate dehydratase